MIQGIYVDDKNTLGSHLRKQVSDSYYIKNMGTDWNSQNMAVRNSCFKAGDVVIIQAYNNDLYSEAGLEGYSLLKAYQQCPGLMEHIFDNLNHVDNCLLERIANEMYGGLEKAGLLTADAANKDADREIRFGIEKQMEKLPEQLSAWLQSVKKYKGAAFQRTGAIVMNCNPFTLGHRYLIEKACSQVEKLLVFVVEEDKSFFKFKDRMKMVQIGTEDLANVVVIPSGQYIISASTLPGYFEKDSNSDVVLDAALDLNIFADVIAKELGIGVRFAGEEPMDLYTRQYNLAMSRMLPKFGIDFVEIPRKKIDDKVISAFYVRKLMEKQEYSKVKGLVMPGFMNI